MNRSDKRRAISEGSEETIAARFGARLAFAAVLCGTVFAVGVDAFHEAVAVPSLPKGLFQQKVVAALAEVPESKPQDVMDPVIEHTIDNSDVKIEARPKPVIEPRPEPMPEVKPEPKPEPKLEPEPEPEPPPRIEKPKAKPVPKHKPAAKAAVKPKPVVEPQAPPLEPQTPAPEICGQAEEGASGGAGGAGMHHAANSNVLRQSALALIVDTIDANKSYPRRARQNGIEGTVVLRVTIGSDGRILTVDVRKKHASVLLNRAALKAADKLIGMRLEGIGPLEVDVPVVFDLQSRN